MCSDDELVAFVAGELGDDEATAVEAHVDRCPKCRAVLAALARALPLPSGPARVGNYRIGELVGRGAMGAVYIGEPLDRPGPAVALKLLPSLHAAALLHFKHEFRAAADLSHRNLVQLYELGSHGNDWFIAMELVDGTDFLTYVSGDEDRLRAALCQLADGLAALHAHGHVHRDIKPANVLVEPGGRVVILDFGLAAALAHDSHTLAGTPAYMAPERKATIASDFYAVGVLLHEALAGRRPGATPSPPGPSDLVALCRALLEPDPAARAGAAEIAAALGGAPPLTPAHVPFIGRERELATLADALAGVSRGSARTIAVEGASGIGKTTLVARFLRDAAEHALIVRGRCYDRETVRHKALDALVDELARLLGELPQGQREVLRPDGVAELAHMFPVLGSVFTDGDPPAERSSSGERRSASAPLDVRASHAARRTAAAALCALLAGIATHRPLILWIDDLQWGDAESAPLLAEIAAIPSVLLLASHRPGPVPALGDLARTTLALEPLPLEDARALASALGSGDAERIARESEGNPLFIAELARAYGARGATGATSLDGAIRRRHATLPAAARDLLDVIAIAGRSMEQALLARVTGAGDAAFARLRAERWIEARGTALETVHDRVRVAIRAALAPDEVASCHRRLATALEGLADPEVLLEHWLGAREPARAQPHAVAAAAQAMRALTFERAARLYGVAASLVPLDDTRRAELCALRGDALAAAGRGADAAAAYEEARALVDDLDYRRRAAEQLLRSGRVDRGLEAIDGVLRAMRVRSSAGHRGALISLALGRLHVRFQMARPRRRREPTDDELRKIDTLWAVASTLGTVDTIRAAELHARTLVDAVRAGEPMRLSRSFAAEAAFVAAGGHHVRARADRLLARAREVCDPEGDPLLAGTHASATGMVAFLTGRWTEALAACDAAQRLLGRCAGGAWECDTARLYALISLAYLGRLRELRGRLMIVLADAEDRGDLYVSASARTAMSNIAWLATGDLDEARRHVAEGERMWSRRGFHLQHYWSLMSSAQADLYAGDGARAYARIAERWPALVRSRLLHIEVVACEALHLRARAAIASGHSRHAERDLRRLARMHAPHGRALADLGAAALLDPASASARLERAQRVFTAVGMELHAHVARRARGILADDGASVSAADAWMRGEGIADPPAIAAMLFPRRAS